MEVFTAQSCLTLCNPMDCIPPGFSVRGILQARILEWEALPFSRKSSQPRDRTRVSCFGKWILYCLSHQQRENDTQEALDCCFSRDSPGVPLSLLVLKTLTSPSAGCALSLVSQTQRHCKPTLLNSPSGPLRLVLLIRPPL